MSIVASGPLGGMQSTAKQRCQFVLYDHFNIAARRCAGNALNYHIHPSRHMSDVRLICHSSQSPFERILDLEARASELMKQHELVQEEIQKAVNEAADAEPEAEELARIIEEGGTLPPLPTGQVLSEPESAEDFKARIEASIAAVEHAIDNNTDLPDVPPDDPTGWWKGPFDNISKYPEDEIRGLIPAPDLPPEIEAQTKIVERIMYVVRRAHLGTQPIAAYTSLYNKGLLAEEVGFEDPWMELSGSGDYGRYMQRLEDVGVEFEVCKIFAECYSYDPVPQWRVMADVYMNFPIPLWYYKYLHFHKHMNDDIDEKSKPIFRSIQGFEASAETMFPRHIVTTSEEEENGTAYLRWLRDGSVVTSSNATAVIVDTKGIGRVERFVRFPPPSSSSLLASRNRSSTTKPIDYSSMLPIQHIVEEAWQDPTKQKSSEEQPVVYPPIKKYRADGLTPDEAEEVLRGWLGDDFDSIMAQMPKKESGKYAKRHTPGNKWKQGNVFTIALSLCYVINPEIGQIDYISGNWGEVAGPLCDVRDAYDVYLQSTGVMNLDFVENEGESDDEKD